MRNKNEMLQNGGPSRNQEIKSSLFFFTLKSRDGLNRIISNKVRSCLPKLPLIPFHKMTIVLMGLNGLLCFLRSENIFLPVLSFKHCDKRFDFSPHFVWRKIQRLFTDAMT